MGTKMAIISRELIKPSSPTPDEKKVHKLSMLDQFLTSYSYTPLFFYANNEQLPVDSNTNPLDNPSKTTLHLEESLSECLTRFYPLARKLNPDDEYQSIDCDDCGVLFVEAKVDEVTLSEAVQRVPLDCFGQYLPFQTCSKECDKASLGTIDGYLNKKEMLFGVKITWFQYGGHVIGVCISHRVADFASLVTFMNSWAATHRGAGGSEPLLDFDEKITELKELAVTSSIAQVRDPTRVEVAGVFLWKQFIKLERAKNHQASATARTWIGVNLRSRISCLASLASSDGEFPFGNLVAPITGSFPSIENLEETDLFGNLVQFTSWCRFLIYEVDIGWGKPVSVGPAGTLYMDAVILTTTRDEKGVEAWIGISKDDLALVSDELLSLGATNFFQILHIE
ncbi:OLC1v1020494C1 [Oldenlandia corymbosa var. corymbosa]|uniref:OLC1v1020494C1 n=1 Tax=Oldenlandia corymbosa var. corymbosa TaxID=529605 RepID=A0AAV1EGH2_OLDCO|nr:OLC1v1020494C1 [Oldenlandia corymbosa var. corymbosa]